MQRHEPRQKLTHRREVAIFRPQIRKPLIQERAIGLETGPIEPTMVRVPPLLEPPNKRAATLEIRASGGGPPLELGQLPREGVEIDPQADEG